MSRYKQKTTIVTLRMEIPLCGICETPIYHTHMSWEPEDDPADAQFQRQGALPIGGDHPETGQYLCKKCRDERVVVTCFICQEKRTPEDITETHCNKPFCQHCYETVSAQVWENAIADANDCYGD